ncbi:SfnB family sulfur acquisition oxidoreductase [Saccharopolyspora sp. HNM0983]|uniref:SfnB family sulfur acquisition oxidoreductase n=1 Tax=Saccharopolyspora montiporae TaxID=2781240 RepID=A0A929BDH2_9PSEU|nr:SfnB family sulfur acquisition oxidoreductase [Saccharopolyspora sp. HNM0983]MBE9375603.1 SfnB family sulfur acquisition oxidoreductase [Saccharopolyspora sp. HNM0983]
MTASPQVRADRVRDDAHARELAAEFARRFAADAADRDTHRRLPRAELDALSRSGLLAGTVPREHGGAELSTGTLVEVFRLLATADPNIAQIPQSHIAYINVLRENGTAEQQRYFFAEVLAGKRFGNAQSETGSPTVQDIRTRLIPDGVGYRLDGTKGYSTGALLADWIPVLAKDPQDRLRVAYVPHDAPGLTVVDDWGGMGQRTTASGTVRLDGVPVPAEHIVAHHLTFDRPQLHGALAQAVHAAIDTGIARGALEEAAEFVRNTSRPWGEAGVERADQDPLTIQRFGELTVRVRAAEALLAEAGAAIDRARQDLDDASAAAASISVATAKAAADGAAVELGSALFEVSGTRSALDTANLHRHWRNARTHTLHDPVRWKIQHIGRYALTGEHPPRTGQI